MKIGLLTTFGGSDEAYSLVVVVKTQLQMLNSAGYHPALFVCPSFTGEGLFSERVTDIRKTITADASAEQIVQALEPKLLDIDVMATFLRLARSSSSTGHATLLIASTAFTAAFR